MATKVDKKNAIRQGITEAEIVYFQNLAGKTFLYVCGDEYFEVSFPIDHFLHLTGVETRLSAKDFYKNAKKSILTNNQFYFDAVLLFIMPPSAKELERRLVGRGTEDEATIRARLSRASEEAQGVENYNYIVINDDVDACVETIDSIVKSEKRKAANNINLINNIKEELKAYSKGE